MDYTGKSLFDLEGKVAVVTGGAGLIGERFCRALSAYGACIVIADMQLETAQRLADEISVSMPGKAFVFKLDITSEKSIDDLTAFCLEKWGKVDILVNCAYPRNKNYGRKFEDIEIGDWNDNIAMHAGGYFLVCQKISGVMQKQKSGKIINIASIYGMVGPDFSIYEGTTMTMPAEYSMIKGGIINFTKYLATYLAGFNINVNCISPGGIYNNQPEAFVQKYCSKTPMKRMGTPDDLTGTLIYLASEASKYVTGQNIAVDGGWTAW